MLAKLFQLAIVSFQLDGVASTSAILLLAAFFVGLDGTGSVASNVGLDGISHHCGGHFPHLGAVTMQV